MLAARLQTQDLVDAPVFKAFGNEVGHAEIVVDRVVVGNRHGEGPGCYCRINQALTKALDSIRAQYDLIMIDNEAGLEHLSRYRVSRVDLFLIVLTQGQSSWAVADQIKNTTAGMEMELGETWLIYNRAERPDRARPNTIILPETPALGALDQQGGPLLALKDEHCFRSALWPVVDRICVSVLT